MNLTFPESFDFVKQDFEKTGVWEPRTTNYIKEHLKEGQVFLDIGAQVGYFSVLAGSCGAKVIAFEPSTSNREFLEKNLKDNNCEATVIGKALSNTTGKATLYTGKTAGENSLVTNYHNGVGSEEVETVRYDDLGLPAPDFIKLDVEGFEQQVLEGMESVLTTKKPTTLIVEDWRGTVTDWLADNYGWWLVTTDRGSGNRILTKNQPSITYEEEPIRCHLLGTFNAPNTLKDEGIGNAFGTKVINMAKILRKLGHYIIFYGVEGSEVDCDEFVQVSSKKDLETTYGPWDKTKIYKENYGDYCHKIFNSNCIKEINQRKRVGDFLLVCHGTFHKEIADSVGLTTVEIGIGHRSSFAEFRIFESEFQRAWTYGCEDNDLNPNPIPGNRPKGDGRFYDCVIPGFFDPDDFEYCEDKDDYFLYLGRVISKKGIFVAQEVCEKLGKKLVVAGFGYDKDANAVDAKAFEDLIKKPYVEYVGFAGKEKRKHLMAHAKALFLPTLYLEPFGYVVLEANLSGTPVITTDFGAFPETISEGYNGYRCRTFKEFVEAVSNIENIKPENCRKWGMKYTLDKTAPMYQRYFSQILDLHTPKGWYKL